MVELPHTNFSTLANRNSVITLHDMHESWGMPYPFRGLLMRWGSIE